jgi:hypothetical protein
MTPQDAILKWCRRSPERASYGMRHGGPRATCRVVDLAFFGAPIIAEGATWGEVYEALASLGETLPPVARAAQ